MLTRIKPAATPLSTIPIAAPPWSLRTPADELRAVVLASRARVGLAHALAIVDVQHGPGRRA